MKTSNMDPAVRKEEIQSRAVLRSTFSSPEPEIQRGRRRVRSPMPFSLAHSSHHHPHSTESSTFRGRSRHRSASVAASLPSRNASRTFRERSFSPTKQRLLRAFQPKRRRSQSPSRSRSVNGGEKAPPRRRQRTRSRSRTHRLEGSFAALELTSPLHFEMVAVDEKPETEKQPD